MLSGILSDNEEFLGEKGSERPGAGIMKPRSSARSSTNESIRSGTMDKSPEEEESDDPASTNPCHRFQLGCHDNGMGSDFNCQSINNNTIDSFECQKTKADQHNRISVVKEGKTYYQETMKKEKTLKRQFSIQAEHDYHGKFEGEGDGTSSKSMVEGSGKEGSCEEGSVVNGSHAEWDSGKVSDGELSKHLISFHINESEVKGKECDEDKIEVKDNTGQIDYSDAIDNSDYRYFYNENSYKSGSYSTGEYYASFRNSKGDVMFNEKDLNLINEHRGYNYHGSGSGNVEFANGNEIVSFLRQQDEMFLIQDAFQNPAIHKNIDQVIADTLKSDEDRPFGGYLQYHNGNSPKDEGSSNSSQETEKINSKILNLSHIKYSHPGRISSVLVSTESNHRQSHGYDEPMSERLNMLGRGVMKSEGQGTGTYAGSLNERISLLGSDELDFEHSPSPNGELQSLDSPPVSRSQGEMVSMVGNATSGGRFHNASLHSSSTASVMHCLNSLTTNSSTTGGVLQGLSPQRDIGTTDCDEQVLLLIFFSFKILMTYENIRGSLIPNMNVTR